MNLYHEKAKLIQQYLNQVFAPEDTALCTAKQQMQSQGLPAISIPPFVGKLLTLLAKLVNAKHILEIGTLGGYSTIWLARALPEDGRLISLEIDPKNAAVAKDNLQRAGLTDKVEIRLGDALQTINTLSGPFDLIFLDADKPRYPLYLEPMLRLGRPGGLLVADNLIRRGKVVSPSPTDAQANALASFNKKIANHPQLESVVIPTLVGCIGGDLDGLSLSRIKT